MKKIIIACLSIALAASITLNVFGHINHQQDLAALSIKAKYQGDENAKNLQAALDRAQDAEATQAALQAKVIKLSMDAGVYYSNFEAANAIILNYQRADLDRTNEEAKIEAEIKPPEKIEDGPVVRYLFASVVGKRGGVLMENALFISFRGTQLLFKENDKNGKYKSIDAHDVHPLILKYLSLDLEALELAQSAVDADTRARRQTEMQNFILGQQANAIQAQAQAKIALAQQQVAQEEADKQAALLTERIKANAAMVQAQQPPAQINITQQSQQQAH